MSTVHRDRGFANKDGDGKALTPPHTAELARMAELHRGVSEVCCRSPFACSGIRAAGANARAAAVEGRAVGGGAQKTPTALAQRCCSAGAPGAGCVLLPLFSKLLLFLFSHVQGALPFLLWPLPFSCPSHQNSCPAELKTLVALK